MAEYRNPAHYNDTAFQWDPANQVFSGGIQETSPGYLPMLMQYRDMVRAGTAKDYEAEQYRNWEKEARAIPTRDIGSLTSGWQGESQGQWTDSGWQGPTEGWWGRLDPLSPDVGPIMLQLREKLEAGKATPQERELYGKTMGMASDWDWRATTPQASDAFSPLGDNLMGALGILAMGASGGLAAAPLAAGTAGLSGTLASLGTLSGIAGTAAGALGNEMQEPWLQRLGMGLGAAGGIAGGLGGLANLAGTGIQSLGDAARLASSAGRVVGGVGAMADNDILRQAGGWLGTAGQLGGGVDTLSNLASGGVKDLTDAARLASGLGQVTGAAGRVTGSRPLQQISGVLGMGSRLGGGVGTLLGAASQAQHRGMPPGAPVPRTMSPLDWLSMRGQAPQARSVLGNL